MRSRRWAWSARSCCGLAGACAPVCASAAGGGVTGAWAKAPELAKVAEASKPARRNFLRDGIMTVLPFEEARRRWAAGGGKCGDRMYRDREPGVSAGKDR